MMKTCFLSIPVAFQSLEDIMSLLHKISLCLLWSLIKAHETGNKPDIPYDWIWSDDADPLDNYRGTNETCCTHLRCCDLGGPKRQTADDTQVDYEVPIWVPPIVSPGNCKKTKDEYGRMDANFLGHTGIGHTDNNGLA